MSGENSDSRTVALSRRNVLGSIGAVGAGAALGGAGTMAYFSDQETFTNNEIVAGQLDMKVDWQEAYNGVRIEAFPDGDDDGTQDAELLDPCRTFADVPADLSSERRTNATVTGTGTNDFAVSETTNPGDPLVDLDDLKPGDWGEVTFSFHLCSNPGYVWMNGNLIENAENGFTEPERQDADEDGDSGIRGGELLESIRVALWYDRDCDNEFDYGNQDLVLDRVKGSVDGDSAETLLRVDSLANVMAELQSGNGIPLDASPSGTYVEYDDGGVGLAPDGERECFAGHTTHCIGFAWWLPVDHANEIQTDSAKFDLGFYTEQCRHNDGAGIPGVTTKRGSGFGKLRQVVNRNAGYGTGGESFQLPPSAFARARFGDNDAGTAAPYELAVGTDPTSASAYTGAGYQWTSGATVDWSYSYDSGAGEATFTLDGNSVTRPVNQPEGQVAITAKADEATMAVDAVKLFVDGTEYGLNGPSSVTASNDGAGRDIQYLALLTDLDGSQDFTLSGTATVTLQGDYGGGEEGVAFDVTVE